MGKMKTCLLATLLVASSLLISIGDFAANTAEASHYTRPFGDNAPWNRPVRDAAGNQLIPTHADSNNMRNLHWNYSPKKDGTKPGNFNLNPGYTGYTYPVYYASDATGTYPVSSGIGNMNGRTMPWNPAWVVGGGGDGQAIVLDTATGREWNVWQASFSNNTISASNANVVQAAETNPNPNVDPYPTAGNYHSKVNGFVPSRGIGIQYLAMLVRPEEIQDGVIRHALSLPVANTSLEYHVPPATKQEHTGTDTGVEIPEGMRFALNVTDQEIESWLTTIPSDLPNRTATVNSARIIAKAMRDYGWFITDTSGGAHFQLEDYHTAGSEWVSLGLGYNNGGTVGEFVSSNGKTYPQDLLDGLFTQNRIYTLVTSDQYPAGSGGGSTTSLNATADAHTVGGDPATNYGGAATLRIKDGSSTSFDRISYFKFDLSGISGNVSSAKLKVYANALPNGTPTVAKAFRISDDTWTETGITWNNQPALGAQEGSQVTFNAVGWYEIDVSSYVNAELAGNKIVTIALADNTLANKMIELDSKEATNKPVLNIVAAPTTTNLNAAADAHTVGGDPATNYGGATTLRIKDGNSTSFDRISYFKFDLSGISGNVSSAKLKVYASALPNGTPTVAKAFRISDDTWTETGITWNNQPALGAQEGSQVTFNAVGWYEIDVSSYVNAELAGNKIVTIALADNTLANKMIELDSKEATNKPVLVVTQ